MDVYKLTRSINKANSRRIFPRVAEPKTEKHDYVEKVNI